jgi:hypothetical protein
MAVGTLTTEKLAFRRGGRRLGLVTVLALAGLNVWVLADRGFEASQVLGTATICLGLYPMWRYLTGSDEVVPLVPVIGIMYVAYYAVPSFLSFETYERFAFLSEEGTRTAEWLVAGGLLMLLLGFYCLPGRLCGLLPRMSLRWSERAAKHLGVGLGLVGLGTKLVGRMIEVPLEAAVIVIFADQLALLAVAILLVLQLRGSLGLVEKLLLWGVLVPGHIMVEVASGFIFPVVRFVVLMGMIYVGIRRRIPWGAVLVCGLAVFVLLIGKGQFRKVMWEGPDASRNPIERGVTFLELTAGQVADMDVNDLEEAFQRTARRVDLLTLFAFVIGRTPDLVPYWNGQTYWAVVWKLVPRALYPDKPLEDIGQTFGHRYGLLDPGDFKTSVNLPQLIEMYVNFGSAGVLVGMLLCGVLYRMMNVVLNHRYIGEWGLVVASTVFSSFVNIESNLSLVYGGIAYLSMLLYGVGLLVRRRSTP